MSDFSRLDKFGDHYWQMEQAVAGMKDTQLTELLQQAKRVTQTNCWYASFQVAPMVRRLVAAEVGRRASKAVGTIEGAT